MAEIGLPNGEVALVSDEDLALVSGMKWCVSNAGYVHATALVGGRRIFMHRLIMGAKKGQIVDHINHLTLDNRRENLRFVTSSQNACNRVGRKSSSKYKGVCWHKKLGRWQAMCAGKYLGLYEDELSAARAYDEAAVREFGEFACLNLSGASAIFDPKIGARGRAAKRKVRDDWRPEMLRAIHRLSKIGCVTRLSLSRAVGISMRACHYRLSELAELGLVIRSGLETGPTFDYRVTVEGFASIGVDPRDGTDGVCDLKAGLLRESQMPTLLAIAARCSNDGFARRGDVAVELGIDPINVLWRFRALSRTGHIELSSGSVGKYDAATLTPLGAEEIAARKGR